MANGEFKDIVDVVASSGAQEVGDAGRTPISMLCPVLIHECNDTDAARNYYAINPKSRCVHRLVCQCLFLAWELW